MNPVIKDILVRKCKQEDKEKALQSLTEDIEKARLILSGYYRYCPDCDDYYIAGSFLHSTVTEPSKVCTWEDPINSGGNEYKDVIKTTQYLICPKGHRLKQEEFDTPLR